uniref:Uncharacterized protein n=1 Tax=Nonomuraea gerenzanensis TaxID=93944 RepID=A0A1M4EJ47_9ACTN|nr:hypothetical protein BN4615_P8447 [Nonomuraea gerenzanensis]
MPDVRPALFGTALVRWAGEFSDRHRLPEGAVRRLIEVGAGAGGGGFPARRGAP